MLQRLRETFGDSLILYYGTESEICLSELGIIRGACLPSRYHVSPHSGIAWAACFNSSRALSLPPFSSSLLFISVHLCSSQPVQCACVVF